MMGKNIAETINILAVIFIVIAPMLNAKQLGYTVLFFVSVMVLLSFSLAISIFLNGALVFEYAGSYTTGSIAVRIDYLSAWFIMVISFTFLTGAWYGVQYMKKYILETGKLQIHAIAYALVYTALIDICMLQNALVFLVAWEIMALSSFIIVIFEWEKRETLRAGINFFIQSHIAILFITVGFIWLKVKTGTFDFSAIPDYTSIHPGIGVGLFSIFFTGFAIKAGFVPFHTWLPLAHPAAPAHISGVMSGVIIKIGIFGILRMLTLIKTDFTLIGYFILMISVITGVYGVMLAIVQHNLKRLLAYHSIENIGIIGIGIGLGCLGIGMNNQILAVFGFSGALLHTLNHSLFKSLLFFSAGNVYLAAHTMNIESLGGMMKKIPFTGYMFLIGSIAICGLPPFNGFISEFFIYTGLFRGLGLGNFQFTLAMLFSILGLVMIGGLALICFTKAFGIIFLGNCRSSDKPVDMPENRYSQLPMLGIAVVMLTIGIIPQLLSEPLLMMSGLFSPASSSALVLKTDNIMSLLQNIGLGSLALIGGTIVVFLIRRYLAGQKSLAYDSTWGCGYVANIPRAQYTASSFIRTYRKLFEPLLSIKKDKVEPATVFPGTTKQITHPYDKIESVFIDRPIALFKRFLSRFVFLQNGNIHYYILYGFIFITVVFVFPLLVSRILEFVRFLNQL
jgi:hydrogenase-4 component B